MELCRDTPHKLAPIFKVQVHRGTFVSMHVFVGENAPHPKILKKCEKQTMLSTTEKDMMVEAYGKSWETKLGLNSRAQLFFQTDTIYDDDNIMTVRAKIAKACEAHVNDVYLWCKHTITQDDRFWNQYLSNVFSEASLVSGFHVAHVLSNIYGDDDYTDLPKDVMMSRADALGYAKKKHPQTKHSILSPLGFVYMYKGSVKVIPANPLMSNHFNTDEKLSIVDDGFKHVEYYAPQSRVIHCMLKNDVPDDKQSLYFPNVKHVPIVSDGSRYAFDTQYKSIRTNYMVNCFLGYCQLRNLVGIPFEANVVSIDKIFNEIVVDEKEVVFCKKTTRSGGVLIKMSKTLLSSTDKNEVLTWSKTAVFKKSILCDNLILKMHSKTGYVTIVLLSNGTCDIKIKFSVQKNVQHNIDGIIYILKKVNRVLGVACGSKFVLFDTKVFQCTAGETLTRIINMSIGSVIKGKDKVPSIKNIENACYANKTLQDVFAINVADKSSIDLVYRKTSSFGNRQQVQAYIAKHNATLRGNDLAEKLMSLFKLSKDEAIAYAKDWRKMYTQDMQQFKYLYGTGNSTSNTNFLKVRVRITNNGYNVITEGITDVQYYKRILRYLKVLFYEASRGTKSAPIRKAKLIANTNVQVDEDDPDDEPFVAINNDLLDDLNDDLFGDMEEELKMLLNTNTQPENGADDNVADTQDVADTHGKDRLLTELKKVDRILFTDKSEQFTSYARACQFQSMRQPLVVSQKELDSLNKESFTNYYSYRKNVYICPDVWCPKSRVSYSRVEYEKRKEKCPDPVETAMVFYDSKAKQAKTRYISFLQPHKHPNGLCMPCCSFKPKDNMTDADCGAEDESTGNIRYVKSDNGPAGPGRYSVLPKSLSTFLGNKVMGNRPNGSGIMQPNCDAFFRYGVQIKQQSFLYCMSQVLGITSIHDENDIVKAICKNLDLPTFMSLYNGNLLKKFLGLVQSDSIYNIKLYTMFKGWFIKNNTYVEQFSLTRLRQVVSTAMVFKDSMPYASEIRREFVLWYAFNTFLTDYMQNQNVIKTHDKLMDLFNLHTPWLNAKGYNIVVVEIDMNDNIYIPCSQASNLRPVKDFIIVTKTGQFYEPLHHVKLQPNGEMDTTVRFDKANFIGVDKIFKTLTTSKACQNSLTTKDRLYEIVHAVKTAGESISYFVLDYDFQLVGYIIRVEAGKGIIIPLVKPFTHTIQTNFKYVFIDDAVQNHAIDTSAKVVKTVVGKINSVVSKHLAIELAQQEEKVQEYNFLRVLNKSSIMPFIPLKTLVLKSDTKILDRIIDDINMMVQFKADDPRTMLIKHTNVVDKLQKAVWNEVVRYIQRTSTEVDKLTFLRNPRNPIPTSHKLSILHPSISSFVKMVVQQGVVVSKLSKEFDTIAIHGMTRFHNKICSSIGKQLDCNGQCSWIAKFIDNKHKGSKCKLLVPKSILDSIIAKVLLDLLNINIPLRQQIVSDSLTSLDTILFTESDIKNGNLENMLKDNDTIDEWGFKRNDVLVSEVRDSKSDGDTNQTFLQVDRVRNIPTALRGQMRGYVISEVTEYKPDFIFKTFASIYNVIHNTSNSEDDMMSAMRLRELVVSRIKTDLDNSTTHEKAIQELSFNPCLQNIFKKSLPISNVLSVLDDHNAYYPSDYDLRIIAEICGINIFIWGRKTIRTPDNNWCLGKFNNALYTVCLEQSTDKSKKADVYEFFVEQKTKKVVFEADAMPMHIRKKCTRVTLNA